MKTKTVTNTEIIYTNHTIYNIEDKFTFCIVDDSYKCIGYETNCKEEIGVSALKYKSNKFIITLKDTLSNKEIKYILLEVNTKEKQAKVRATKIYRVKNKPQCILIEHSPRWNRSSVAHSILTTWLRLAICKKAICDCDYYYDIDREHLDYCSWLINIIAQKGLRIFGTHVHEKYDMGMVSWMFMLREHEIEESEPFRDDYDTDGEFDDDYYDWEDRVFYGDESMISEQVMTSPLPEGKHAYTRLMKMYKTEKSKS